MKVWRKVKFVTVMLFFSIITFSLFQNFTYPYFIDRRCDWGTTITVYVDASLTTDSADNASQFKFKTLESARDHLRNHRSVGACAAVHVASGIYQLSNTFQLDSQDSFTSYIADGDVTISGARSLLLSPLTNAPSSVVTRYKGSDALSKIYYADISSFPDGFDVTAVYENELLGALARFPNEGQFSYTTGKSDTRFINGGSDVAGRASQLVLNSRTPQIVIFPSYNYGNDILPIAIGSIDTTGKIKLIDNNNASYPTLKGDRFYVEGFQNDLDKAGEWYADSKPDTAGKKYLFYIPRYTSPTMAFLKRTTIEVPFVKDSYIYNNVILDETKRHQFAFLKSSLIKISMGPDASRTNWNVKAESISFSGFNFKYAINNAINIESCINCQIISNSIQHVVRGNGIKAFDATRLILNGNRLNDVGSSGIISTNSNYVLIDTSKPETYDGSVSTSFDLTPSGNIIAKNIITNTGIRTKDTAGITVYGHGYTISYNDVHFTPRYSLQFAGSNNLIEFNHFGNANQETQDSGIIYTITRDWTVQGSIIRNNYLHDSGGFGFNTSLPGNYNYKGCYGYDSITKEPVPEFIKFS